MKKIIVPALALFLLGATANAQLKTAPKAATTASSKSVVSGTAAGKALSVSPAKTHSPATVTKAKATTSATAIKRKHPKPKKVKRAPSKKM